MFATAVSPEKRKIIIIIKGLAGRSSDQTYREILMLTIIKEVVKRKNKQSVS